MPLTLQQVKDSKIASPPGTYFSLREAIENPDTTFDDYGKIIGADPALAARLLKIVNSPFYGLMAKVETIPHALNIIGSNQLSELALATSVVSQFEGDSNSVVDLGDFWKHSVGCGIAARMIAKHISLPNVERFYLAGMLHDLGKLVVFREVPGQIETVLAQFDPQSDTSLLELEEKMMGFNHAQIGGVLLNEWKLPSTLVDAVKNHHDPDKAKEFPQGAAIIHVADFLTYEMNLGSGATLELQPSIFAKTDAVSTQVDLNTNVLYNNLAWAGVSYRVEDAVALLAGIKFETLEGINISEQHWEVFYQFYQITYAKRSGHGGYLPKALTSVGTELEVEYFNERYSVVVSAEPLWDRTMSRMKS